MVMQTVVVASWTSVVDGGGGSMVAHTEWGERREIERQRERAPREREGEQRAARGGSGGWLCRLGGGREVVWWWALGEIEREGEKRETEGGR